jgi:hypothetical protein
MICPRIARLPELGLLLAERNLPIVESKGFPGDIFMPYLYLLPYSN